MDEAFDYVRYHVNVAARELADARGKRVLVVGCNRGREVSLFLDAGAREVWGIDVMDEVGIEYPHERAQYFTMSAEAMDLDDRMFEIVFCLATMEHIARPEAAFPEISRVVAPGGFVYVLSTPLWHSRQGHHKSDLFDVDRYPWIHLRFDAETLTRMCETGEVEYPESVEDIAAHVRYMLHTAYFNQRPARDYVRICSELTDLVIERNDLDLEPESVLELLPDDGRAELIGRVGDAIELRAVTHTLAAWKSPLPPGTPRAATSASALRARLRLRTRLRGLPARAPKGMRTRPAPGRPDPNSSASFGPGLDRLIPPEITDDAFARIIEEIAATPGVREILEIGSSAGEGSTAAWVRGALRNSRRPRLHCIEASTERYAALVEQWGDQDFVRCHHISSIPVERLASAAEVEQFYRDVPSRLRDFELTVVLGWLQQDIDYLRDNGLSSPGIAQIKESYGVGTFDAVLIDGSEFAGRAELEEVYGARYLLLDDTETFKNWQTSRSLQADPNYSLIRADPHVRNGFAVFERIV